jgi:hypothetical protein
MRNDPGHVYLLHFDEPIGNDGNQGRNRAQHYWGHAAPGRLFTRLEAERTEDKWPNGSAAAILANLRERGIGWHVADLLPGSYADEQRYKRRGHAAGHCPTCIAERNHQPELEAG